MRKIVLAVAVVAALYLGLGRSPALVPWTSSTAVEADSEKTARTDAPEASRIAFNEQKSGAQVTGEGVVSKVLADDTDGSRHQRFILTLPSGQTLLVAHNIDLAPRIPSLSAGDAVAFNGVYEWNAKGGVIHWTHHDPSGHHEAGWIKHAGQTYQ